MKRSLMFISVLVVSALGMACSSEEGSQRDREDRSGASNRAGSAPAQTTTVVTPEETTAQQQEVEATVGLGEVAELGDISFRAFDVRSEDDVHYLSGPGSSPETRESASGEYVAVDYVAENGSESQTSLRAQATLEDSERTIYSPDDSVDLPGADLDGLDLEPGEKRASTLFFEVPSGISPESLELEADGAQATVDLTDEQRGEIPPEDYLHVYHLYFNERAYEEAYEMMYDPASRYGITLGDWLSFYEPLWGERYIALEQVAPLPSGPGKANFRMDRTFYGADGAPLSDTELNASVSQGLGRIGEEWKLFMRDDLAQDILSAGATATATATPDATVAEPEVTEASGDDLFDCSDFSTQAEAQAVLDQDLTDPHELDEDGDLQACEDLPGDKQYETPEFAPDPDSDPERDDSRRQRRPRPQAGPPADPEPTGDGRDINCDEVAGPIPTPPGDPNNLDGDGDGLACE